MLRYLTLILTSIYLMCFSCSQEPRNISTSDYEAIAKKIAPLYDTLPAPEPGEWRACHPEEKYISLEQYIKQRPIHATEKRNKIYIQPIGEFDTSRTRILGISAAYLHAFFGLEVKMMETISADIIPSSAKRDHDGVLQLNTRYILKEFMTPQLPEDAAVFIAFTSNDLFPSEDWNFVFGQALTKGRVGVWSIYRFGYPEVNPKTFSEFLIRTLKTASHETGHMFSISHCVKYNCCMNGSNSLDESDKRTTALCPDCLIKLSWNFNVSPTAHLLRVRDFWNKYGYKEKAGFYQRNIDLLQGKN